MLRALPVPRTVSRGIVTRVMLAAALAIGLASCGPTTVSAPQPQPGQIPPSGPVTDPARPVLVALLVPQSATDEGAASAGTALANAGRMAATDLADSGLELRVYDTAGTAGGAATAARQALGEGAALILGPLFGANTPAVAEVAGPAGVNVISFSTDSTIAGGPVFVSGFLPEAEAARIVVFAASRGYDRIGVFHPLTPYGDAALRGAEEGSYGVGARILVSSSYDRTFQGIQDGAEPFAGAATDSGVSAILLPEGGKGLQTVAAFMDYHGLDPAQVRYLGLGQWNASATLQEPTLRGGWFPAPDPDRLDTFVGLYQARYGSRPPFIAVLGYDAVQVAGQLLSEARRVGARTPFGYRELTRPDGFQGALGPLRFRPDGQAERAMAILEVGAGAFEVVDPAPYQLGFGS